MDEKLFRKKNIDRISSPEKLNDYVKVTNPPVWLVLAGIIIVLAGGCIWSIFGSISTNVEGVVSAGEKEQVLYIKTDDLHRFSQGMEVEINAEKCTVGYIGSYPVSTKSLEDSIIYFGHLEDERWVYPVIVEGNVREGIYSALVTVEKKAPISLLIG